MGAFLYRLEQEDGDAGRPADTEDSCPGLALRRHHPAGQGKDPASR
jgi:hypothetical protein